MFDFAYYRTRAERLGKNFSAALTNTAVALNYETGSAAERQLIAGFHADPDSPVSAKSRRLISDQNRIPLFKRIAMIYLIVTMQMSLGQCRAH